MKYPAIVGWTLAKDLNGLLSKFVRFFANQLDLSGVTFVLALRLHEYHGIVQLKIVYRHCSNRVARCQRHGSEKRSRNNDLTVNTMLVQPLGVIRKEFTLI